MTDQRPQRPISPEFADKVWDGKRWNTVGEDGALRPYKTTWWQRLHPLDKALVWFGVVLVAYYASILWFMAGLGDTPRPALLVTLEFWLTVAFFAFVAFAVFRVVYYMVKRK